MFLPNSFQKCRSRHLKMFFRSSCPEVSCKKAVLRDFTKFTGKYLHQNLFVNNVAGQGQQHCFKKRPWHKCFLWILWNLGEQLFLQNTSGGYFKFFKIDVLINFLIFTRKYSPVLMSPFDTVRGLKAHNFNKKERSIQLFSCEYHKTFKNSCFIEQLWWLLLNMVEKFLRISNSS